MRNFTSVYCCIFVTDQKIFKGNFQQELSSYFQLFHKQWNQIALCFSLQMHWAVKLAWSLNSDIWETCRVTVQMLKCQIPKKNNSMNKRLIFIRSKTHKRQLCRLRSSWEEFDDNTMETNCTIYLPSIYVIGCIKKANFRWCTINNVCIFSVTYILKVITNPGNFNLWICWVFIINCTN